VPTSPVLYSTNPWYATKMAEYLGGKYFVWCSEYFDPTSAPSGSEAAAIAPSSSPKGIYCTLLDDCQREDTHSALIRGYRKTFRRLAKAWCAEGLITSDDCAEILAVIKSTSWRIWRPVLYVIPKDPIVSQGRLISVPHRFRAAYGPETQIVDLQAHEFDIIEVT